MSFWLEGPVLGGHCSVPVRLLAHKLLPVAVLGGAHSTMAKLSPGVIIYSWITFQRSDFFTESRNNRNVVELFLDLLRLQTQQHCTKVDTWCHRSWVFFCRKRTLTKVHKTLPFPRGSPLAFFNKTIQRASWNYYGYIRILVRTVSALRSTERDKDCERHSFPARKSFT